MYHNYPCPDCGTTNSIHNPTCDHCYTSRAQVEKAYIDILSHLSVEAVAKDQLQNDIYNEWGELHEAVLTSLISAGLITLTSDMELQLVSLDTAHDPIDPQYDPLRTLFQHGSVPGAHDNAIFALIAWYEARGLSWKETKENVIEWMHSTGSWDRGGFEESTPEEVLEKKKHVYDGPGNGDGYGWRSRAEQAKKVIDTHTSADELASSSAG